MKRSNTRSLFDVQGLKREAIISRLDRLVRGDRQPTEELGREEAVIDEHLEQAIRHLAEAALELIEVGRYDESSLVADLYDETQRLKNRIRRLKNRIRKGE